MTSRPTAIVSVDGFNLYRRRLEGNPHLKWLDLTAMCRAALPEHDVVLVRYFTAC